jgi:hypothetical protein
MKRFLSLGLSFRTPRERELLLRFLRGRGCEAAEEGETDVAVDDCDRPPDLATLVTLVEE